MFVSINMALLRSEEFEIVENQTRVLDNQGLLSRTSNKSTRSHEVSLPLVFIAWELQVEAKAF